MKLNILKGSSQVKMRSPKERKIYEYMENFQVKKLSSHEKRGLSRGEMQLGFYGSRREIKEGIRTGEVVGIDCLKRNFLYFCRESMTMYLLRIEFDLNEIFGGDVTDLMDIREEQLEGRPVSLDEADKLIDNYLEWLEEQAGEEIQENKVEEDELNSWFERV